MKRSLSILVLTFIAFCTVQEAIAQDELQGRKTSYVTVFNDSIKADVVKVLKPSSGHSGWFRVDEFQYFSTFFDFNAPTNYKASGLDTGSVYILQEYFPGNTRPTSSSTGYYQKGSAIDTLTTFTKSDTTRRYWVQSYHGSSDPEIVPTGWIRFYSAVSGALPAQIDLGFIFLRQP